MLRTCEEDFKVTQICVSWIGWKLPGVATLQSPFPIISAARDQEGILRLVGEISQVIQVICFAMGLLDIEQSFFPA